MKNPVEVNAIIAELERLYPDALCSLEYKKDYELLFAVRLSAQCTDARVNQVTPALFARFPTLESFAQADEEEVGQYVHSCGFWRAKAHDLVASAQMLLRDFGGKVPDNMEDLLRLPGVGRKTANLILGDIYGKEGYVCDTHCIRITGRLGITDGSPSGWKSSSVPASLRKSPATSATGWSSTAGPCVPPVIPTAMPALSVHYVTQAGPPSDFPPKFSQKAFEIFSRSCYNKRTACGVSA